MIIYCKEINLGKAALTAPLYISIAWILMISYQLFTQTAVTTLISYVSIFLPQIGNWLSLRTDMIVFVYSFAWIFVLSSVIPSAILGRERSVLIQFFMCLTLTLVAFVVQDTLSIYGGEFAEHLSRLAIVFHNPFLAIGYLLIPYLVMLMLDIGSRREGEQEKELKKATEIYLKQVDAEKENNNKKARY
jgi:signal transduction histidine kinase